MYRSAAGDRSAGGGDSPPRRRRPYPGRLRRRPVLGSATQPLLCGLAEEIGVVCSGDLLMRLRKHSAYKTAHLSAFFPD
jgi:hypothetical protein